MTLQLLRYLIREEVEKNLRWSAGYFSIGGAGRPRKGTEFPPQGLGDEEENEEKEKEQWLSTRKRTTGNIKINNMK